MSGDYAIDGGTISVQALDPSDWKSEDMQCDRRTAFVGSLQVRCGDGHRVTDLVLDFFEDSGDEVPIVSINIPRLYRDRFFSYIAGACSAIFFREIEDEIDAEEDEEVGEDGAARPHEDGT